ncbi:DUF6622 family protein [Solimicrobium silvestre]|uniref:DUF1453 domain-containing protein n=1 Tax=Solimicrobium silvestre TaxID=2099400 RepID=A0A2S9GXW2_9BURK|nr:DUF6622 family protein [Solimicrobium silvestre]PRC92548.1 hypothetical protein S2091_2603 [Solimicrobium silvestre]
MSQLLQMIPTWVFFLFFTLLYLGYAQSKTREVSMARLTILPFAMVILSLYSVWTAFGSSLAFGAWIIGAGAALAVNSKLQHGRGVTRHTISGHVVVPGSWLPLGLMMSIFVTKFIVAFMIASHAMLANTPAFPVIASFCFGVFSGTFFARSLYIGHAARSQTGTLIAS